MSEYDLNDRQKDLLCLIVKSDEEGKSIEPGVILTILGNDQYTLWGCNEKLKSLSDLDALCDAGLLEKTQNTPSVKYRIKNAAYRAVKDNFADITISPVPGTPSEMNQRRKRIFISHASKDEEIVNAFFYEILVGGLTVNPNDIFCTTTDGTKIKSGEDWRDEIKKHLVDAEIIFLLITPNYKESEICLNEMGAAWVSSGKTISLFVEPINYNSVGILQEVKQVEKLQDEKSLDRIKDEVQEILKIPSSEMKSDRWTDRKSSFLSKIKNHLSSSPFIASVTRESLENLSRENESLNDEIQALSENNSNLERLCADLKKAKDKEEVVAIENKYLNRGEMEEFSLLCEKVAKSLSDIESIIIGIIFVSYSKKDIHIILEGSSLAINRAIAGDILKNDVFEPNWDGTKKMQGIWSALRELKDFMRKNSKNENFISAYETKFDAPLSLSNVDFWTEIIGTPVYFGY
jgi:hypothetical protein